MSTTKQTKTWFRLDLYKPGKKGIKTQSWYPTKEQALRAQKALRKLPFAWRVNGITSSKSGGMVVQGPFEDKECKFVQP